MKKPLLILALFAALAANYCRTPAPATSPLPPNYAAPKPTLIAQNVSVGEWSAIAVYDGGKTEFHILFSDSIHAGMAMYRIDGAECWEPAETCGFGNKWTASWDTNFIRINADGTTEGSVDGKQFMLKPTQQ